MPRYPHRITTTRPGLTPGVQDPATGRMVSTPVTEVIYAGPGDAQHGDRRRPRDSSGEASKQADASIYLASIAAAALHQPDDDVVVEYVASAVWPQGRRRTGRVIAVGEDQGAIFVVYLGAATDGVPA